MGSETLNPTTKLLPIIDFAQPDLKPGSPSWDSVRNLVRQALEEYGCFEASFPRIPLEDRKNTFSCLEEVFDLPLQTKVKNTSNKPYHGYVGQYPTVPLYESMGIDGAQMVENVEEFTRDMWPEGNVTFCKNMHSFSKQVSELDQLVKRMIFESFGVEKYLDEHIEESNYLLRVQKYKGPKTTEPQLGITSHTDKSFLTILYQNLDGLEVKSTKDGDWIKARCSLDSFIVLIGVSLHAWLNGRLCPTFHRVTMTGNEARYSLGLFSFPNQGYVIKAAEELVDEDHPLLYKPYDHVEFLSFYHTEEGQRSEDALKAYCGA
ncbi:probable 2-oxoglutarate-dependent dioxygenase AOP1 [Impatiens glandulifera]|uniref:probable 2-oxoglutarate-dependent dioxygenase AOP1 n=1 Tax=Impatiens glandulifera TaxID=253017 RepID=UPI001FB05EC2|nr:probable 2-oxoglutarate-dependent dioxygenase AOP1 [Impatiens glandulifera]